MRGGTAAAHGAGAGTADSEGHPGHLGMGDGADRQVSAVPTEYRLLADLRAHGLDLAQGTITDGMRRLAPLFAPLREALIERSRTAAHWHADETRSGIRGE